MRGSREGLQTVRYVLRRTARAFGEDRVLDMAAGLTYFGMLAVGPAAIAVVSLLSLLGQSQDVVTRVLDAVADLGPEAAVETVERILEALPPPPSAGAGLVLGLVGALWSASAYVSAFSRAMNRVHDVEEGRPYWRVRPFMLLVTLLVLALLTVVAATVVVSGPLTRFLVELFGVDAASVRMWSWLRWPVVLGLVIVVIAALYYVTPNVRLRRFRLLSAGSVVALLGWIIASAGFNLYVSAFGRYDAVYGSLGGLIVFLLWLWISNIALLVGAELDAEIERVGALRAGLPAEDRLQLPPRDTTTSMRRAERAARDAEEGRAIRERAQARRAREDDADVTGVGADGGH